MNILTGVILLLLGSYSIYQVVSGKKLNRMTFHHQMFLFEWLAGKKNAMKALYIFTSIIEIFSGIAFLTGKISW